MYLNCEALPFSQVSVTADELRAWLLHAAELPMETLDV